MLANVRDQSEHEVLAARCHTRSGVRPEQFVPLLEFCKAAADLDVGHPEGKIVFSRGRFRITRH